MFQFLLVLSTLVLTGPSGSDDVIVIEDSPPPSPLQRPAKKAAPSTKENGNGCPEPREIKTQTTTKKRDALKRLVPNANNFKPGPNAMHIPVRSDTVDKSVSVCEQGKKLEDLEEVKAAKKDAEAKGQKYKKAEPKTLIAKNPGIMWPVRHIFVEFPCYWFTKKVVEIKCVYTADSARPTVDDFYGPLISCAYHKELNFPDVTKENPFVAVALNLDRACDKVVHIMRIQHPVTKKCYYIHRIWKCVEFKENDMVMHQVIHRRQYERDISEGAEQFIKDVELSQIRANKLLNDN